MTTARSLSIVGPTASGKTAAAVALARRYGDIELVSVDAMAVYRGLDIGTAKPTSSEREGLVWHCIDLVEPTEEFSVAQFQHAFESALTQIAGRGHRAVLVGGTGLYHRAAVDGLELAGRYGEIAVALEARAAIPGGAETLYRELRELDPIAASRIEATNVRRIVRALEVTLGSGRPFSSFGSGMTVYGATEVPIAGLAIARAELASRIECRLARQLEEGFVEEVKEVIGRVGRLSKTAAQALGYRELIDFLEARTTYSEATARIVSRTKRFARRQEAWFRRDPRVVWIDALGSDLVDRLDELLTSPRPGARMPEKAGGGDALSWNNGQMDRLTLYKYEGLGNDFLVLVDSTRALAFGADAARALCDRHRGVGADGLLRISSPSHGGDLFMELRNADGSIAETSGNGLRCAALAAYHEGLVDTREMVIETVVGSSRAQILSSDDEGSAEIRVEMGRAAITRDTGNDLSTRTAYRVDIGNPHLVLLASRDDGLDVREIGPALETSVPGGLNVELVTLADSRASIRVDTWERGAGYTLACGTGSCAAASAAYLAGLVDATVTVENPGGDVFVELSGPRDALEVTLTGVARRIFAVTLDDDELASLERATRHRP